MMIMEALNYYYYYITDGAITRPKKVCLYEFPS